ncbi:MAG: response regulator [Hyphomonadaceae bacterium]
MATRAQTTDFSFRALVVEDSPTQGKIIVRMLESLGCAVKHVETRRQLNTSPDVLDFDPDVVFLDIHLSDGNGLDMIDRLRERWPGAVMVVMTTNSMDAYRGLAEARDSGAHLVLPKPFVLADAVRVLADARAIRTTGRRSTHVVVIDDSRTDCEFIASLLERFGVRVSKFVQVEQAIECITYDLVDVVVTDLLMPEASGHEVIQLVRDVWPDVGVIAITAKTNDAALRIAADLGADVNMTKPFQAEELMRAVEFARRRSIPDVEVIEI